MKIQVTKSIHFWLLILSFFLTRTVGAQHTIHGLSTYYDDSFQEWIVYFDDEGEGTIELKWPLKRDWTEWEVDIGDYFGFVKQRSQRNPDQWEAKINGQLIEIRTVYPRDHSQWIIKSFDENIRLKLPDPNNIEHWTIETKNGYFDVFTTYIGDIRDWEIEDELHDLSMEMKISAITMILYLSCPNI